MKTIINPSQLRGGLGAPNFASAGKTAPALADTPTVFHTVNVYDEALIRAFRARFTVGQKIRVPNEDGGAAHITTVTYANPVKLTFKNPALRQPMTTGERYSGEIPVNMPVLLPRSPEWANNKAGNEATLKAILVANLSLINNPAATAEAVVEPKQPNPGHTDRNPSIAAFR